MPLPQSKFREIVLQLMYNDDMGYNNEQSSVDLIAKELAVARSHVRRALEQVTDLRNHLDVIDAIIAKAVHSYSFERIQRVERNILRLAIYELTQNKDIPPKVCISEGMRLARKFSTPESANFINAVLDNIYKEQTGEVQDIKTYEETILALKNQEEIAKKSHQIHDKDNATTS